MIILISGPAIKGDVDMNNMKINESLVFDACALIEQISGMTDIESMQAMAKSAALLLNQAMEEGELV